MAHSGVMTRRRAYFVLMGCCLSLFVLAWGLVRFYSVTAAVVMSVAALAIPPVAVMVANAGDESRMQAGDDRGPDDDPGEW
jgi:hypothetical protein